MPKEKWKKCSCCGIITDVDEKNCPRRGLKDNPKHELQVVELEDEEIKKLYKDAFFITVGVHFQFFALLISLFG